MFRKTAFFPTLAAASALLLHAPLPAQTPQPQRLLPAPQDVLDTFHLRSGTLQVLDLPAVGTRAFRTDVLLDGVPSTLHLALHDVRGQNFRLLVHDASGIHEVPAPAPVTYRGTVEGIQGGLVAASLKDTGFWATILAGERMWAVQPAAHLLPGLPAGTHVVYAASAVHVPGIQCGVPDPAPGDRDPPQHFPTGQNRKVADFAIDADLEYYQRNGSDVTRTQNAITTIMNSVDAIYQRDTDIEHEIVVILVRTVRTYSNTNMSSLLGEFRNRWNANHTGVRRAIAHLFTGKGSFSGVIGIAYLGVVCSTTSGYAVSKAFSTNHTSNVGLVAHEIGHNWNAPHCNSFNPCNIMCSGLGGCSRNLSSFAPSSISRIVGHKNTRTCLRDPAPRFPPAITSLLPTSVTSFGPGEVTVTGTELGMVDRVTVGGINAPSVTPVNATTLRFIPPNPFEIGTHPVQAFNQAGASAPVNLTVSGNHPSHLDAPLFLVRNVAQPYRVHTDRNWTAVLLVAGSQGQSLVPGVVDLGIGNNFASLLILAVLPADVRGVAGLEITVPPSVPLDTMLFWQAVTFDAVNPTYPLEVSNVAINRVVF